MSIRPLKMFPIFTIANIRIFRFRSRHFAISNNFQYDRKSFSQGGKKKRWYYLNGGYPNVCRDRESQDRESENTVARHHWLDSESRSFYQKTWNKASVWAYEVYLLLKSCALYRSTSWLFEIYIERVSGREGTDRGVRNGLGGRTRRDATNRDKSRRRNPLSLTRGITSCLRSYHHGPSRASRFDGIANSISNRFRI